MNILEGLSRRLDKLDELKVLAASKKRDIVFALVDEISKIHDLILVGKNLKELDNYCQKRLHNLLDTDLY
jgi:hypothetical protein